jgi:hypothetical protein
MCFFYLELLLTCREVGEQGRGIGLSDAATWGDMDGPAGGKTDGELGRSGEAARARSKAELWQTVVQCDGE